MFRGILLYPSLHGVLMAALGMTCPEAARPPGDTARSVEYWTQNCLSSGLSGLRGGWRSGRSDQLHTKCIQGINTALRQMPRDDGLGGNLWEGKALADLDRQGIRN